MDLIWGPLNRPKFGVAKVCVCRVVRGRSAGPNSGPPGGLEFGAAGCASAQAFAFFKWINFALSEAPADRDPLIVNMDETALAYHIPAAQGTVATVARRAGGGQAVDHASLADTRGHVSYLATIASDPTVQPQLPQVTLGNEHKFTLKALRSVAPDCPPNIHLWRQKSAWNNHCAMRKYICLLARCLGDLVATRYVILLVDFCPAHVHMSIYRLAKQKGLRLVYVPASMTRYLQPCDTHFFGPLKATLRDKWRLCKSEMPGGRIDTPCWLRVVFAATQETLELGWAKAFLRDGLMMQQERISEGLMLALGLAGVPELRREPPSLAEAKAMPPRGLKLNIMSYVCWAQPRSPAARKALPTEASVMAGQAVAAQSFRARPIRTLD